MSAQTCAQVAEFVRRRNTGEISSDAFFASLANVQLQDDHIESVPDFQTPPAGTDHASLPHAKLSTRVAGLPSCPQTWLNLDMGSSIMTSGTSWGSGKDGSSELRRASADVYRCSVATESEAVLANIPSLLSETEATQIVQHMRNASNVSSLLWADPGSNTWESTGEVPRGDFSPNLPSKDLANVNDGFQREAATSTGNYWCNSELPELPAGLVGDGSEKRVSSPRNTLGCSRSSCTLLESPLSTNKATACQRLSDSFECSGAVRSLNSSVSEFSLRSELWESNRSQRLKHLRCKREAKEVEECTFQPFIRRSMQRSASEAMCEKMIGPSLFNAARASQFRRSSHAAVQRWIDQREENLSKECTFTPDLRASTQSFQRHFDRLQSSQNSMSSTDVTRPYKMPLSHSLAGGQHGATLQESTSTSSCIEPFMPQTNEVSTDMVHAREYLKKNVFERLAQTPVSPRGLTTKSITPSKEGCDMSLQDGSSSSTSIPHDRPQEAFTAFMQRQRDHEEDRLLRMRELEIHMAPPLQPRLCPRSRAIVEQRQAHVHCSRSGVDKAEPIGSSCRQSTDKDMHENGCIGGCPKQFYIGDVPQLSSAAKGYAASARTQTPSAKDIDPECSFQPEINATSARLPPRGAKDLSTGEQQRRCIRAAELRERIRQADPMTPSAPVLCAAPAHLRGTKGKLRVLEDAAGYTERIQQMRLQRDFHAELKRQQRTAKEMEECTFCPEVNNELPVYVRNMADYHRSVKYLWDKQQCALLENSKHRPDWR